MTDGMSNDNGGAAMFEKYRNPDSRCEYPFTPDPTGYCWSFAHHVDGTKGFEHLEAICPTCECWSENAATLRERERREK
jgi:hypothetical protein